jgi:hypothetical protein
VVTRADRWTARRVETKFLDCNAFVGGPLPEARVREVVETALILPHLASTSHLTGLLGLESATGR